MKCNEDADDDDNNDDKIIEWRVLKESSLYEVSNTGYIKHKRLNRILQGHLINGYRSVSLTTNESGNKIHRLVHRLVAETFIENNDETSLILNREIIMIPSSPTITMEEQQRVVNAIAQFLRKT